VIAPAGRVCQTGHDTAARVPLGRAAGERAGKFLDKVMTKTDLLIERSNSSSYTVWCGGERMMNESL
jgi:hypothetical protein